MRQHSRSRPTCPPPTARLSPPITYLITDGRTTRQSTVASAECRRILALVERAVAARVSLIQIREKNLTALSLYELTAAAARLTRNTPTRLLVNERADVALGAGAGGVHLPGDALTPNLVRRAASLAGEEDFLIGVSTHSVADVLAARRAGASFAVFGPIYATPSKARYNLPPLGVEAAQQAVRQIAAATDGGGDNHAERAPFPLLGLGGVTTAADFAALARAGMSGVAGIRLFGDAEDLPSVVRAVAAAFARAPRGADEPGPPGV